MALYVFTIVSLYLMIGDYIRIGAVSRNIEERRHDRKIIEVHCKTGLFGSSLWYFNSILFLIDYLCASQSALYVAYYLFRKTKFGNRLFNNTISRESSFQNRKTTYVTKRSVYCSEIDCHIHVNSYSYDDNSRNSIKDLSYQLRESEEDAANNEN